MTVKNSSLDITRISVLKKVSPDRQHGSARWTRACQLAAQSPRGEIVTAQTARGQLIFFNPPRAAVLATCTRRRAKLNEMRKHNARVRSNLPRGAVIVVKAGGSFCQISCTGCRSNRKKPFKITCLNRIPVLRFFSLAVCTLIYMLN